MSGRLGPGERAPDFVAPGPSGQPARFYAHAGGRPTVLLFNDGAADLADRLAGRDDVALWRVADEQVAAAYGVGDRPAAVVLDPNLRVVEVLDQPSGDRVVELLDRAVHSGPAVQVTGQAPVLLLPDALPAGWCDRLIEVWESAEDVVETGVARGGGEVLDDAYKRRRDLIVAEPLLRELSIVVGRRVMPEVRKAFAYRASRFEGFKIACYDAASGGFFRPHRDNLTKATAHRVFALSLNLNQEYEGGQLRFPEYGNQLYRPDAGAALVFSCAHLHEVCAVTAGRRFVLLSFLYGA